MGFECGVRHCLVVFTDAALVFLFGVFHELDKRLAGFQVTAHRNIFLHLFRRYKLDISFFIVMHLDFQNSQYFSFAAVYVHSPLAPPSSVPKVFGTVLVVLNAHHKTFACLFREHSRNPVFVVALDISYNLCFKADLSPSAPSQSVVHGWRSVASLRRWSYLKDCFDLGSENLPSPRSLWS